MSGTKGEDRVEQIVQWVRANQRTVTIIGVGIAIVGGGIWFSFAAKQRREAFADRELNAARATAEAGNYPLAASDLQRIVERYRATSGGQEAAILLAQVRLLQGQAELAAAELQTFVRRADRRFRDQALGLYGSALEQAGRPADAAAAFLEAAEATGYEFVAVQMLLSAGRAFTVAGDTAGAERSYQQILDDHGESGAVTEAQLRLAELRRA